VKVALAAVTLLLMASMGGGFLLLPLLIPMHIWAARRSRTFGRVAWSLLPTVAVGTAAWAAVYVAVGEAKPAIWLLPLSACALAVAMLPAVTSPPKQTHRA
jgi:hypothetical protein